MKAKKYRMLELQARCIRRRFASGAIVALSFIALSPRALAQSTSQPGGSSSSEQGPTTGSSDDASKPNPPSLLTPLKPVTQEAPYVPIRPRQRLRWFITETIGPPHLAGGLFTAAFGTAFDRPKEYGPHWGGFADRYGMRMTGIVTGNAMEASIGAIWGEDPRYFRVPDQRFRARVTNVVKQTFVARHEDGSFEPAYARYIAFAGNNFLSNQWRVESEANNHDAVLRTAEGFAGRMVANAFEEFWPDVKTHVLHSHSSGDD
jgi:hypothetical protein